MISLRKFIPNPFATLVLLLILIHAAYFLAAIQYRQIYTGDSVEYLNQAKNIADYGNVYSGDMTKPHNPRFESLRPPVYGFFIYLIRFLHPSDYAILLVQNILHLFVFLMLYRLIKASNQIKQPELLVVLAALLFPATFRLANSVLSDNLFQTGIFVALILLITFLKTKQIRFWVFYNLTLVLCIFIKPALLYFWIFNLVLSIIVIKYNHPFSLKAKGVIVFSTLLLPAFVSLWSLRNEKVTGYRHFSSITTQNILECYAGNALTFRYNRQYSDSVRRAILDQSEKIENYKEKSEYIKRESVKIILEKPLSYGATHIRGMIAFMLDPGRLEIVSFFPVREKTEKKVGFFNEIDNNGFIIGVYNYLHHVPFLLLLAMVLIFLWNMLLTLSTISFAFNKSVSIEFRIGLLALVAYLCSVSVFIGFARFRSAIYPILIILLPYFINQIKKLISSKKRSQRIINKIVLEI